MICGFHKGVSGTWQLLPRSGKFKFEHVADVDGMSLSGVGFDGLDIFGTVEAVWGMSVLDQTLFDDPATVRGIIASRNFRMVGHEALIESSDGYYTLGPADRRSGGDRRESLDGRIVGSDRRVVRADALWALGGELMVLNPQIATEFINTYQGVAA